MEGARSVVDAGDVGVWLLGLVGVCRGLWAAWVVGRGGGYLWAAWWHGEVVVVEVVVVG